MTEDADYAEKLIGNATIGEIIVAAAYNQGVDPTLALCIAWTESGFNPRAEGDWTRTGNEGPFVAAGTPGAHATSFGLYQLHEGGELGSLTTIEAFNPITNANTALSHVGAYDKAHPGLTPGELAAQAQGPANPTEYAQVINALYDAVKAGHFPAGWVEASSIKSGLTILMRVKQTVEEPEPTAKPVPKSVTVTVPVLVAGDGMPPSEPDYNVKVAQALLSLNGSPVGIDGRFGPITETAVGGFQTRRGLTVVNRIVDQATWEALLS